MPWEVKLEPHEENGDESGKNVGGLVLYLVGEGEDGEPVKSEFSAVAYIRRNSKNKMVRFKEQLQREMTRAEEVCEVLNNQHIRIAEIEADVEERKTEAIRGAEARVKEVEETFEAAQARLNEARGELRRLRDRALDAEPAGMT